MEALSNMGATVVVSPSSDDRVDRFDHFIGLFTRLPTGTQTGLLGSHMNLPYRAVSKHLGTMGE